MKQSQGKVLFILGGILAAVALIGVALTPRKAKAQEIVQRLELEPGELYQVDAIVTGMPHPTIEELTSEMELYPGVKAITIEEQADGTNHMSVNFEAASTGFLEVGTKVNMFGAELLVIRIKKLS